MPVVLAQFGGLPVARARSESVDLRCVQLDSIEALDSLFVGLSKDDTLIIAFEPPWAFASWHCLPTNWLEFHRKLAEFCQKNAKKGDLLNRIVSSPKKRSKVNLLNITQFDAQWVGEQLGVDIEAKTATDTLAPALGRLLEDLYLKYLSEFTRTYESLQQIAIARPLGAALAQARLESDDTAEVAIATVGGLLAKVRDQQAQAQRQASLFASEKQDLQSENDLLLTQLHQVQEELESYHLKNKTFESAASESAQRIRQLESDKGAIAAEREKDQAEIKRLQSDHQRLQSDHQRLQSDHQRLQSDWQALESKRNALEDEKQDLKSEADLLLTQLHQVQEELERYYLKNKDLEASVLQAAQMVRQLRIDFCSSKPAGRSSARRIAARGR